MSKFRTIIKHEKRKISNLISKRLKSVVKLKSNRPLIKGQSLKFASGPNIKFNNSAPNFVLHKDWYCRIFKEISRSTAQKYLQKAVFAVSARYDQVKSTLFSASQQCLARYRSRANDLVGRLYVVQF